MATFLDITILGRLSLLFTFVLIWVLTYALLSMVDLFKSQQNLKGLIAVCIAVITLFFPPILRVIEIIIPWFSLMFIFLIFVLLFFMLFGVKLDDIKKATWDGDNSTTVRNWILVVSAMILLGGLGYVFFTDTPSQVDGQSSTSGNQISVDGTGVGGRGVGALESTFFHPKVLGLIIVMLMGVFAVLLLTK
jgi:hypothetical protein